jgi:glycosyltransferase involved in cell wall biosynthesis
MGPEMDNTPRPAILILVNVRWWNATAFYAINIARLLDKAGYTVFVGSHPRFPAYRIARQYHLKVLPICFNGYNPCRWLKSLRLLLRSIKDFHIAAINSHRSEDHSFAWIAKTIAGVPWVLTRGDQRKIKSSPLSAMMYRRSDAIILTCESILKNNPLLSKTPEAPSIVYGSVDHDHFGTTQTKNALLQAFELQKEHLHVGWVGRLSPVKDPWTFLRAIAELPADIPPTTFILAGPPCEIGHSEIASEARRLGIHNRVLQFSKLDNIADLMSLLDIGIITSLASETISRVLLELMYLGKPVIGTSVNAIAEIVAPGETGALVPPKAPRELARQMELMLKDSALRKRYGQNAGARYRSRYSEAQFRQAYIDILDRVT